MMMIRVNVHRSSDNTGEIKREPRSTEDYVNVRDDLVYQNTVGL